MQHIYYLLRTNAPKSCLKKFAPWTAHHRPISVNFRIYEFVSLTVPKWLDLRTLVRECWFYWGVCELWFVKIYYVGCESFFFNMRSSGLWIFLTLCSVTWVYISVVFELLWPNNSWIYRKSVPLSNKCVVVTTLFFYILQISNYSCMKR